MNITKVVLHMWVNFMNDVTQMYYVPAGTILIQQIIVQKKIMLRMSTIAPLLKKKRSLWAGTRYGKNI